MKMQEELALNGGNPVRESFLPFAPPLLGEEEINEVVDTLKSGWLTTGPKTKRFEQKFADYKGVKHALALNSCTAGLFLALNVLGVKPGDEIITTPMTFTASASVIGHNGAKPVFVDVKKETMNIDPDKIEAAITPRTKGMVIVHFGGNPCEMDKIMEIARRRNLFVLEDCAHVVEAEYKGQKMGTFGDFAAFSFYANKNMTKGEGGMLITNRDDIIQEARVKSLHGMSKDAWKRFSAEGFKPYDVVYLGYKFNMMDIQAALGLHQMDRVEKFNERRKEIFSLYDRAFETLEEVRILNRSPDVKHAYHLYQIFLNLDKLKCSRNEFVYALQKENIGV